MFHLMVKRNITHTVATKSICFVTQFHKCSRGQTPYLSSSMNTQAFASGIPFSSVRHSHRVILRRSHTKWRTPSRAAVRACLPSSEDEPLPSTTNQTVSEAQEEETVTKTEKIAALLGQSKASMTESANKVREQAAADNRYKYGLALASTALATAFFLAEKLNPNASVNLLHFLETTSAPLSAIGTNNKPSFVEFGATWCENCKLMAKSVFELENEYGGLVNFVVVDGDDPKNLEVMEHFKVDGIPQISMVGRDGSVKGNFIGRIPKEVLAQDLDALLDDKPLPFPGQPMQDFETASS